MTSSLVLKARLELAKRNAPNTLSAEEVVKRAITYGNRVCVAWSGGRCSTIVLHMALKVKPGILVAFNNTGVEYAETVRYVRQLAEDWRLNYHELRPKTTFWRVVEKHGFPQFRGSSPQGVNRPRRPYCCVHLKEQPARQFYRHFGVKAVLTGLRAEESRARALTIAHHGQVYRSKRDKLWKFHPIALWSFEEMQAYVDANAIPINPIYAKGADRCGCWPCTGFASWREQLATVNSRAYRWLNQECLRAEGRLTLWEYADSEGCKQEAEDVEPFGGS